MHPIQALAAAAASAALAAGAFGGPITVSLSTDSSDGTPAELLKADFTFDIVGSTLSLIVENRTDTNAGGEAYDLTAAYFNAPSGVTLSDFSGPADWSFKTGEKVGTFGKFGFAVSADITGGNFLLPGDAMTFTWTVSGASDPADLVSVLSVIPPGDRPRNVAAKFMRGPGDDSAFGAGGVEIPTVLVPLPTGAAMALAGGACLLVRRRR